MSWCPGISFVLVALAVGSHSRADAHGAHVPATVKAPKAKKSKIEPARIVVLNQQMGRFVEALQQLGHRVDRAVDSEALRALLREKEYDVAVVPLTDARALLSEIRIGMIVPIVEASDDRGLVEEFSFNIPAETAELKRQIDELHRALALLPRHARKK